MSPNDGKIEEVDRAVDHPAHYNQSASGVECITVVEHLSFCIGNAIKYLWRCDHKNGLEDLKKARWYIDREIGRREKEGMSAKDSGHGKERMNLALAPEVLHALEAVVSFVAKCADNEHIAESLGPDAMAELRKLAPQLQNLCSLTASPHVMSVINEWAIDPALYSVEVPRRKDIL